MYALQNVIHYQTQKAETYVSKKPTISLEKTTYLLTLYTIVHGYKRYGGSCCLHSELKGEAQA
jgi:hypothetical protein